MSPFDPNGHIDEAKAAFAEMIRAYPDLTISKYKEAMVFSGPTLDRMARHLQSLGLVQ
jgi:adenylate cyclase